ncbi:MAG TPA: hypothetical protein VJT78_14695 [Candidatus Dormibacteraeota bacterium]|nr:hypothetical protein [Candidatus Dormibacteraeota bacterium]
MRSLVLKAGATCLTVAATALSAFYVTAHLKNPAAPLRPAVLTSSNGAQVNAFGGNLTVGPSVTPSTVQPVTSTYAS